MFFVPDLGGFGDHFFQGIGIGCDQVKFFFGAKQGAQPGFEFQAVLEVEGLGQVALAEVGSGPGV